MAVSFPMTAMTRDVGDVGDLLDHFFLNATLTSSLSPWISTTLQKVRSPRREKSRSTRLPPTRRLRMLSWFRNGGSAGLTMFSSFLGALGRTPKTDVSRRKTAPDAQACGEHETGYCTGSSNSPRWM